MKNSFNKLIIIQIFCIVLFFKKYESKNISYIKNSENKPENKINDINETIFEEIVELIYSNFIFIADIIKEKIPRVTEKCIISIYNILLDKRNILKIIVKKFIGSGFTSNLLENENECIEDNDLYLLLAYNYSFSYIYQNIDNHNNQYLLFIETLITEKDLCYWGNCTLSHSLLQEIFNYTKPVLNKFFSFENIILEGINYKYNGTTLYREEHHEYKDYKNILNNLSLLMNIIVNKLLIFVKFII